MTKKERIKNALALKPVDRVPVSAWMHFSDVDQDPISLAKKQIEFVKKHDYDFIKLMPFGLYSTHDWGNEIIFYCDKYKEATLLEPAINTIEDYSKIKEISAIFGTYGKTLLLAKEVIERLDEEIPVVQTIFTPLTTLSKLTGGKVFDHLKTNPDVVHNALKIITKVTKDFVCENIKLGVDGFFLATQSAIKDLISEEHFDEFCAEYDIDLINSYKDKTYFNIIHIHGENIYFDKIALNYPINCINWHDRQTKPSLEEAREKYNICFLGGIREVPYFVGRVLHYDSILYKSTISEVYEHCLEAINSVDKLGIILGPGCVVYPKTNEENLDAISDIVKK